MKTFVIGDIHGAYKALLQCLQRSGFRMDRDKLICLGDVCDRGPEVARVFDTLLEIKNLIYILGNHDHWAGEWSDTGQIEETWYFQGGIKTIAGYPDGMPPSHHRLIKNAHDYYLRDNKLFVHGGILLNRPLEKQDKDIFIWDRSLVSEALSRWSGGITDPLTSYSSIFVGHTPTINSGSDKPIHACEVWLMDTGAGWGGKLSMMNTETFEIFQSDPVLELYDQTIISQ